MFQVTKAVLHGTKAVFQGYKGSVTWLQRQCFRVIKAVLHGYKLKAVFQGYKGGVSGL